MQRKRAIELVQQMPDSFQIDELIEKLIFIEKVEEGLKDVDNGETLDHEEIVSQIAAWSKK